VKEFLSFFWHQVLVEPPIDAPFSRILVFAFGWFMIAATVISTFVVLLPWSFFAIITAALLWPFYYAVREYRRSKKSS
jgi:Flp pilus assembly protein TadB